MYSPHYKVIIKINGSGERLIDSQATSDCTNLQHDTSLTSLRHPTVIWPH